MHLVDKLEKLGLDDANQDCSAVSPTVLMAALENLTWANNSHEDDLDVLTWSKCDAGKLATEQLDASALRRTFSNSSVEAMSSPKMSPMHRSSSVGLNMISDLGSPSNCTSLDIRAKFQVV